MAQFDFPHDLIFNRRPVRDPLAYVEEVGCASWLYLNGEEFAATEGGMSYGQVQAAVDYSANVVSDPPRILDLDLARQHVSSLDELPRPTLITCRAGPRASAVAYMFAGLRQGADPEQVLLAAEENSAPFCAFSEYRAWVKVSIEALRE